MTHHLLHLESFASKGQWGANKQTKLKKRQLCSLQKEKEKNPLMLHVFSPWQSVRHQNQILGLLINFSSNRPVPWARSAGLRGWTPVSLWTPVSPADFWSHFAPHLRHCWPKTWPAFVETSPSCAPGKQKFDLLGEVWRHNEMYLSRSPWLPSGCWNLCNFLGSFSLLILILTHQNKLKWQKAIWNLYSPPPI